MNNNYDDIINLPHYVSKKRPQMSIEARSAQFAPFAALSGYDEQVKETARLTNKKIELEDEEKEILNNKLLYILENINSNPEVTFTYFIKDMKKDGGYYNEKKGIVRKIDMIEQYIQLTDRTNIPINDVIAIDCDIFNSLDIE